MNDSSETYKKQPSRKRTTVKRVVLSADAKKAYEEMVQKRDERDRDYARHLGADNKPR